MLLTYPVYAADQQIDIQQYLQYINLGVRLTRKPDIAYWRTAEVQQLRGIASINAQNVNTILNWCRWLDNRPIEEHYRTFYIPKHSGGHRRIDAPDEGLSEHLRFVALRLAQYTHAHDAAYAYVQGRCAADAARRHAATGHKYYLKIDLKDFFGSCSPVFIKTQLRKLAEFHITSNEALDNLINTACLHNGLPQGTPLSPHLTNLVMLPIDHTISEFCRNHGVTYTRYADDMTFSANQRRFLHVMLHFVRDTLRDTPLQINDAKTKFTTNCGKNYVLGLMIGQNSTVTVGHKKKEEFKAKLCDFAVTHTSPIWTSHDAQVLLGTLQYYLSIEPEYFNRLLTKYSLKFNIDIRQRLIEIIKNG